MRTHFFIRRIIHYSTPGRTKIGKEFDERFVK